MSLVGIVGPIVGPIGTRREGQVGSDAWVNSDISYTFAIGGIPFIIAPGDERPYQRQTATFRKQQIDQSNTVGEQSLDGFWRRSQLSFHKGAGIRYFDATDDTSVANRAYIMDGVDPWTAGEVTLALGFNDQITLGHTLARVGYDGGTSQLMWLRRTSDSHIVKNVAGVTTDVSTAASAAFAVDPNPGGRAYYTNALTVKTSDAAATIATGPSNWTGLWWAKGRLIGMDATGRFYSLVPNPSAPPTLNTSDAFWAGTGATTDWSVADSPGAIYMARGGSVYRATLDDDGNVPTLDAAVTAAELPQGETISSIAYYLGYIVLVTSQGTRIGLTDTAGNIQYGPLLFTWASSKCRTVGVKGSIVYVSGRRADDTHERVFAINLAEPTTDGAFAWAIEKDIPAFDSGALNTGTLVFNGDVLSWDGARTRIADTVEYGTGTLETGFIRFGTMEPKAFHAVRVKLDGTGGNVTVVLVRRGGGETTLTSVAAAPNVVADIPLNVLSPEEFIGLKFILTAPDGDHVPILLGYQLTALPAPKRQRMVEIPLLCYDKEVSRSGQPFGYQGKAWDKLQELERMEESAGEVLMQDFRNNEQSVVFIEQIQFINRTPPKNLVDGFGGIVILTLRQV